MKPAAWAALAALLLALVLVLGGEGPAWSVTAPASAACA